MKTKKLIFLLAVMILTASCGSKKNSSQEVSASQASVQVTFVKGDPSTIIDNTTKDTNSFINSEATIDFDNYTLTSINQFTEKEILVESTGETNIESGNEAKETDQTLDADKYLYKFEKGKSNEFAYTSEALPITLNFKTNNLGKLELTDLETDTYVYPLKALHYSLKNTKDAFSILAETTDPTDGKVLISFTFVKKEEKKLINKVSDYYKYIFGAGVIVKWDQNETLKINICSKYNSFQLNSIYQKSVNTWSYYLKGRLNLETNVLTTYPPFSDLNTHCIYTVDNYQTEYSDDIMNPGTTYTSANKFRGSLLDSDIMIWVKENEKTGSTLEDVYGLSRTVTHEIGHLLGLDHQFSGTSSIMSYNRHDTYITSYDRGAITTLYPEVIKENSNIIKKPSTNIWF